jgi:hypothetical protein
MDLKGYRLWLMGQLDSTCRAPPRARNRIWGWGTGARRGVAVQVEFAKAQTLKPGAFVTSLAPGLKPNRAHFQAMGSNAFANLYSPTGGRHGLALGTGGLCPRICNFGYFGGIWVLSPASEHAILDTLAVFWGVFASIGACNFG